jgi:hypothetical protein
MSYISQLASRVGGGVGWREGELMYNVSGKMGGRVVAFPTLVRAEGEDSFIYLACKNSITSEPGFNFAFSSGPDLEG